MKVVFEDLRKWFNPSHPEGGWKRINSKGEAIGPCAREPGELKPKCMSNAKRAALTKKQRAAAVRAKRKYDPNAARKGKPINVSNFGKGKLSKKMTNEEIQQLDEIGDTKRFKKHLNKILNRSTDVIVSNQGRTVADREKRAKAEVAGGRAWRRLGLRTEDVQQLDEKNKPTNPKLWAKAIALAKSKFDVYPSAYANGWASKWYKSKGGGWKSINEDLTPGRTEVDPTSSHYVKKRLRNRSENGYKRLGGVASLRKSLTPSTNTTSSVGKVPLKLPYPPRPPRTDVRKKVEIVRKAHSDARKKQKISFNPELHSAMNQPVGGM